MGSDDCHVSLKKIIACNDAVHEDVDGCNQTPDVGGEFLPIL